MLSTLYRADLPPRPHRIAGLPLDERGFPVPWFVAKIDGKWDFRCIKPGAIEGALRRGICWLCGERLYRFKTFVVGPMCGVNRTTAEPPCHTDCAEYAVKACPFLSQPLAVRRERDMPECSEPPAGYMIKRNPGCTLLWTIQGLPVIFRAGRGFLFKLDDPVHLAAWAKGRPATRHEIWDSIDSGLPLLRAEAEKDGPEAVAELGRMVTSFELLMSRELRTP